MKTNYPKIGIRPTIDGRQGGILVSAQRLTVVRVAFAKVLRKRP